MPELIPYVGVCADSFEFLRYGEPDSVDVILTDPPYNDEVQSAHSF